MNGYVEITFSGNPQKYTYMVPDCIKISDIQNWVVVENSLYQKEGCPYKIVEVKNIHNTTWNPNRKHLKYIVETIDGKQYKMNIKKAKEKKDIADELSLEFARVANNLSTEDQFNFLSKFFFETKNQDCFRKVLSLQKKYLECSDCNS